MQPANLLAQAPQHPWQPGKLPQFALCRTCSQWASAQLGYSVICRFPQEWNVNLLLLPAPGSPTSPPPAQLPLFPP